MRCHEIRWYHPPCELAATHPQVSDPHRGSSTVSWNCSVNPRSSLRKAHIYKCAGTLVEELNYWHRRVGTKNAYTTHRVRWQVDGRRSPASGRSRSTNWPLPGRSSSSFFGFQLNVTDSHQPVHSRLTLSFEHVLGLPRLRCHGVVRYQKLYISSTAKFTCFRNTCRQSQYYDRVSFWLRWAYEAGVNVFRTPCARHVSCTVLPSWRTDGQPKQTSSVATQTTMFRSFFQSS